MVDRATPGGAHRAAPERILVIRLGALGDLVLCFQAFHDIRQAHPKAKIALLTMSSFVAFARLMPWFDEIIVDHRPSAFQLGAWSKLVRNIRAFNPDRIYDLQAKTRQTILFGLLSGPFGRGLGPEWSGAAPLASHPRPWPPLPTMHFKDFIAAQLQSAGILSPNGKPELGWLEAPYPQTNLPSQYVLLIPGCSPRHPYKRWPAGSYAALANSFEKQGLASIAVGTSAEAEVIEALCTAAPQTLNLAGKTTLPQLATLARGALAVVGNDTGPTHLAAAVGAPTLSLMSGRVNPVWSAPSGPNAQAIQRPKEPLENLSLSEVLLALTPMLGKNP